MNAHASATANVETLIDLRSYLDLDGYMKDPALWDWKMAQTISHAENGVLITREHRKVIKYVRKYYCANNDWPMARQIKKATGCANPCRLFQSKPETIFKIAGLPNPGGHAMWGTRKYEICP